MSADALKFPPSTSAVWDAGDLGCGELVIDLRKRLMAMPGQVMRVIALDPGAPEDLPSWCRMTGHQLIRVDEATSSYWILARGVPSAAESPAPEAADVDEIYGPEIFALARALPPGAHLEKPDATAKARSPLCGSAIEVDLALRDGVIVGYAQRVQACLLGRASASVVARAIDGASPAELLRVGQEMRAMLSEGAHPPAGRWADLAALAPVRALKSRHPSTLLVFDAIERALSGPANAAAPAPA